MSVYHHQNGLWYAIVERGRDEHGKRMQKWSRGFVTRREAKEEEAELLGKRKRGLTINPDKTPLKTYLTDWLRQRESELAPLTVEQYSRLIRNHIAEHPLGATPLADIRKSHIRVLDRDLQETGVGPSVRQVVSAVVHKALADAVADDFLAVNPADKATRGGKKKEERPRFTVWTENELRDFLDVTSHTRLAALWRLAVTSGARRGELLGLTWLGFDREAKALQIHQQAVPTRGGTSITPLKTTGSHRTISLDDGTVEALERHAEAQFQEKKRAGIKAYEDRDLIFADELGGVIRPGTITDAFTTHRKAARIRPGRLHDLRHTHATHLLTRGVPVHVVSARLGHSSPTMTYRIYAHVLPRSDEQAAEVMAEVLG